MKTKKLLYAFLHVPKNAGTTVNKHLINAFKEEEYYNVYDVRLKNEVREQVVSYYEQLPQEKKDKIKYVYGHHVWFGFKNLFPNREVRFIVIIREPLARAVSHYRFNAWRISFGKRKPFLVVWDERLESEMYDEEGVVVSFSEWLVKTSYYPNYTSRYLQERGFESLEPFYFAAILENSRKDFAFIYHLLGVKRFFSDKNKTSKKIEVVLTTKEENDFCVSNDEDYSLYVEAKKKNELFYATSELNTTRIIRKVNRRKRVGVFFDRIRLFGVRKLPVVASFLVSLKKRRRKRAE